MSDMWQERAEQLGEENQKLRAEVAALDAHADRQEAEVTRLRADLERRNQRIGGLEDQVERLRAELEQLHKPCRQNYERLRAELKRFQGLSRLLERTIDAKDAENERLRASQ